MSYQEDLAEFQTMLVNSISVEEAPRNEATEFLNVRKAANPGYMLQLCVSSALSDYNDETKIIIKQSLLWIHKLLTPSMLYFSSLIKSFWMEEPEPMKTELLKMCVRGQTCDNPYLSGNCQTILADIIKIDNFFFDNVFKMLGSLLNEDVNQIILRNVMKSFISIFETDGNLSFEWANPVVEYAYSVYDKLVDFSDYALLLRVIDSVYCHNFEEYNNQATVQRYLELLNAYITKNEESPVDTDVFVKQLFKSLRKTFERTYATNYFPYEIFKTLLLEKLSSKAEMVKFYAFKTLEKIARMEYRWHIQNKRKIDYEEKLHDKFRDSEDLQKKYKYGFPVHPYLNFFNEILGEKLVFFIDSITSITMDLVEAIEYSHGEEPVFLIAINLVKMCIDFNPDFTLNKIQEFLNRDVRKDWQQVFGDIGVLYCVGQYNCPKAQDIFKRYFNVCVQNIGNDTSVISQYSMLAIIEASLDNLAINKDAIIQIIETMKPVTEKTPYLCVLTMRTLKRIIEAQYYNSKIVNIPFKNRIGDVIDYIMNFIIEIKKFDGALENGVYEEAEKLTLSLLSSYDCTNEQMMLVINESLETFNNTYVGLGDETTKINMRSIKVNTIRSLIEIFHLKINDFSTEIIERCFKIHSDTRSLDEDTVSIIVKLLSYGKPKGFDDEIKALRDNCLEVEVPKLKEYGIIMQSQCFRIFFNEEGSKVNALLDNYVELFYNDGTPITIIPSLIESLTFILKSYFVNEEFEAGTLQETAYDPLHEMEEDKEIFNDSLSEIQSKNFVKSVFSNGEFEKLAMIYSKMETFAFSNEYENKELSESVLEQMFYHFATLISLFSFDIEFLKSKKKSLFFYAGKIVQFGFYSDNVLKAYCTMYKKVAEVPVLMNDVYFLRKNFIEPIIFAASGPFSELQKMAQSILNKI